MRRDSRVTTGISGFLLGWPWEAQSSPRVARESWGLRSSHCPVTGPQPLSSLRRAGNWASRALVPHKRLPEYPIVPREKTHSGAAVREKPRRSLFIARCAYAILLFTASDLASITSHIHNWVLFLLWLHPFILSGCTGVSVPLRVVPSFPRNPRGRLGFPGPTQEEA